MKQKGFGLPLVLLVILVVALVVVGIAYYQMRLNPHKDQKVQFQSPEPISRTVVQKSYFQELLSNYCDKSTLSVNDLPIAIDQSVIKVNKITVSCEAGFGKAYAEVYFDNDNLLIYDDYSEELGHGGYSYFRMPEPEEIIKKTNDTTVAIWLNSGEGGRIVGDTWIVLGGIKRFEFSNGQVFYAKVGDLVIDFDDPRLIALLKQYAEPIEGSDDLEITKPGVEQAIIKQFFNNLKQVDTPEKDKIARIEKLLNSVAAK